MDKDKLPLYIQEEMTSEQGAGALAILLVYASYKLYKRLFSEAARACKDKSGQIKTVCMNKYRRDAIDKQIKYLEQRKSDCKKAKKPEKCVKRVENAIKKLKQKRDSIPVV